MHEAEAVLRAKINSETGCVRWPLLERHYARGVLVSVAADLDLVTVAVAMATDDQQRFNDWLAAGKVHHATPQDAMDWHGRDAELWAVVAAPWVLVQEVRAP